MYPVTPVQAVKFRFNHQSNPGQVRNDYGGVSLAVALMIILTVESLFCGQTLSLTVKINMFRSVRADTVLI